VNILNGKRPEAFLILSIAGYCTGAIADGPVAYTQLTAGLALEAEVPTYMAVRSKAEWTKLRRPDSDPVNTVDFGRSMALVASPGKKPNSGYGVMFKAISEFADRLEVSVLELELGEGCIALAVLSHPTATVLIPASNKRVVFQVTKAVENCTTSKTIVDER
jgi:hypothetical protein